MNTQATTTAMEANEQQKNTNTAILAEILSLSNLLLIPVVPFLVLWSLFLKHRHQPESLAFNHIKQTFIASIWAGFFIVVVASVFYFLSNISAAATWTIIITYFTCIHSLFVMYGIYGLSKAMTGNPVKFPFIK